MRNGDCSCSSHTVTEMSEGDMGQTGDSGGGPVLLPTSYTAQLEMRIDLL